MRVLGLFLLVVAFLLPGHHPPWLSFEQEAMASAAFGVIALSTTLRPNISFRVPTIAWLAVAVSIVPLIQWLAGEINFLSDAAVACALLIAFALAATLGAATKMAHETQVIDGLCCALIFAGIVSTGIALMQFTNGNTLSIYQADMPPQGRPYANLAQPNHFATLLTLGVASTLHLYLRRRLSGLVTVVMVAWLGLGVVMSQSRTGWAFAIVLLAWWVAMRKRANLRLAAVPVVIGVVLFFSLTAVWTSISTHLMLSSEGMASRLAQGWRPEHWRTLWDAALRSPWIGYGWGQVASAQLAVVLDHKATGEWLTNSHNLFLDVVLWNGFPIAIVFIAFIVRWAVVEIIKCRKPETWATLLAVGALTLHALVEFPLDYAYFLLPLGFLMGHLEATAGEGRFVACPRPIFVALCATMLCLLGWLTTEYLRVEEATQQLRFVAAGIGTDKVATAEVPDVSLLDQPREYHRFLLTQPTDGMTGAQLNWMRTVVRRNPSAFALFRMGVAEALNDQPKAAHDWLAKLCRMHSTARCSNAGAAWKRLGARNSVINLIPFPEVPRLTLPGMRPSTIDQGF